MIVKTELKKIAKARVKDADILFSYRRYDGAVYLCGYAIELALKARICNTLKWEGFPESNREFRDYNSFRTHDLDVLLHLSGKEIFIKTNYFAEWSAVVGWSPSSRYQIIGTTNKSDVESMIDATKILLSKI
ncbi:HEPN domain-containing protein [bacterium]|nr:HEPN domain-containing protein [bacterium]